MINELLFAFRVPRELCDVSLKEFIRVQKRYPVNFIFLHGPGIVVRYPSEKGRVYCLAHLNAGFPFSLWPLSVFYKAWVVLILNLAWKLRYHGPGLLLPVSLGELLVREEWFLETVFKED
jgi:hypothetical protein